MGHFENTGGVRATIDPVTVQGVGRNVPVIPPTSNSGCGIDIRSISAAEAHAYSTHGAAADQTFAGRLAHLENIFGKMEVALGETRIAVIQAEKKAQQALGETAHLLKGQIGAVDKKIEETATGGIHVAAVGAIWIFFGTVFGGLAPELHKILTL